MTSLILVEEPCWISRGHDGTMTKFRCFSVWLNGVKLDDHAEDMPNNGYAKGEWFTYIVENQIARLEKALGVKALRAKAKPQVWHAT